MRILGFLFLINLGIANNSFVTAGSNITYLFNRDTLNNIDNSIRKGDYGKVTGLVIMNSNGKVLHERYYGFSSRNTLNPISSVTKSVTSLLVGICLEKGFIKSIDVPVWTYFPEYSEIFEQDTLKKQITLRNILSQTSGLKWEEWEYPYNYTSNSLITLLESDVNWIQKFFSLPVDTIPGVKFSYNSLGSQVVAEVISRASGMKLEKLADEYLFKPLSIKSYHWDSYPNNELPAWGGISLTTLDMAKLGLVVADEGSPWGNQIVTPSWIDSSTDECVYYSQNIGYGLHWWVGKQTDGATLIYAAGYGDQYVFVAPDKGIVIAINAQNFSDYRWPKSINTLVLDILSSTNYSKS